MKNTKRKGVIMSQEDIPKIKKQLPVVKLDKRSQQTQERISKWVEAQSNYSSSIITIIEYMINRFGYVDVTDFDIIKTLSNEKNFAETDEKLDYIIRNIVQSSFDKDGNMNVSVKGSKTESNLQKQRQATELNKQEKNQENKEMSVIDQIEINPEAF